MQTQENNGSEADSVGTSVLSSNKKNQYVEMSVSNIITKPNENVRSGELPEIDALAKSIKAEGVLEPIIVTAALDTAGNTIPGKYSVVAGYRRLTAVRLLELPTIPAVIVDADGDRRLRIALIENLQREDMNALDKARGIAKLLASGIDQKDAAKALGVAPGFISQYVGILELPKAALSALGNGEITFTQARSLCRLMPNVKAIEDFLFDAGSMTVAQLDAQISHILSKSPAVEERVEEPATEGDDKSSGKAKKKKAGKQPAKAEDPTDYYRTANFDPLKKDELRAEMARLKMKEMRAETPEKQTEYRLILKGLTIAANLRLR